MFDSFLTLLAHGADPRPIRWDEATANLVKFFVTILLALVMSYPVLAPLFPKKGEAEREEPAEASEDSSGLVGWVAIGLTLVLSMAWWLTRTSIVELTTAETPMPNHAHAQERGGQIAMWGDFHAEVARIQSGEVRVYLTDSYNRPIAARFFEAEITPVSDKMDAALQGSRSVVPSQPDGVAVPVAASTPAADSPIKVTGWTPKNSAGSKFAGETKAAIPGLADDYRFALMGEEWKAYRVKVKTPGWSVNLKFAFDGPSGRRSLPIWCGTPGACQ